MTRIGGASPPVLTAFPMHGQHKLLAEGYRTRDGHLIEWFGRLLRDRGPVAVISRPEPMVTTSLRRVRKGIQGAIAANTVPVSSTTLRLPTSLNRQRWWTQSLQSYHGFVESRATPVVTWNPFLASSNVWETVHKGAGKICFDLLDDWTIHYAFAEIRKEVNEAYAKLFDSAEIVTANAEGTVELAERFGRSDVVLLTNGVDPERFDPHSIASGAATVGYVGKIGKRLDLELITSAARQLPDVRFVFAGPILDAEYKEPLQALPNIQLLGDVHYERVPELLRSFDIGWVPHRVGEGEVGGDVIKTYEYRAAGLPVLTTPISGTDSRRLDGVTVLPGDAHREWIRDRIGAGSRVARMPAALPLEVRWSHKASFILRELGMEVSGI